MAVTFRESFGLNGLEQVLGEAIEQHMVSDVPIGAFLSGGIDSSLVAALMQEASAGSIGTYSIGFRESDYDESVHARAVAAHLGTHHHEIYASPQDALDTIPDLPGIYDEPFADSSQIPTYLVARLSRKWVTVALSGDGGDELMAGYSRYSWANMIHRRFGRLSPFLRRALAQVINIPSASVWNSVGRHLPESLAGRHLGDRVAWLATLLQQEEPDDIYDRQHTQWLNPEELVCGARAPTSVALNGTLAHELPDFLTRMQFCDSVTYLPDDVLTKVDRASMAVGLEARVPLLDHRVVEFVWRLPRNLKIRDGQSKWLFREILYRRVPQELVEPPKMGFGIPISSWLRGPLREWAEELLTPSRLHDNGLLRPDRILADWQRLIQGQDRFQEPLWGILMYQAWREHTI